MLDDEDPFEVDEQLPHLFKHPSLGYDDVLDVWFDSPVFYPAARPPAELIMVGNVAGEILLVPLCPPNDHNPAKCRPIGVYKAGEALALRYQMEP